MIYNKLVRDQIPDIIRAKGERVTAHVASDDEYWVMLKEKLQEEVVEFLDSASIEELADILEVLDAIVEERGWERDIVTAVQHKKAMERGRFTKRIILEEA